MTYIVSPTDPTTPTNLQGATQGAEELRALKAYIQGLGNISNGRKNAIIGGNFDTNPWQRGTNFAAIANVTYCADRWRNAHTDAGVCTVARIASAPTLAQSGMVLTNCLEYNVTTADAAVAAGDRRAIVNLIEGYNYANLAQEPMVLSFWHKHTKAGINTVYLSNTGGDQNYVAEYTQLVADTWEFSQIPVTASPAAGTWSYTNGIGIQVGFMLMAGATFQGVVNAWNVVGTISSVNQVNHLDTIGNRFRIANVQLEAGTLFTSFERRNVADELALCQRYFAKTYDAADAPATVTGNGALAAFCGTAGASAFGVNWKLPVSMRITPSAVFYSPVTGAPANWRRNTGVADVAMGQFTAGGVNNINIVNTGAVTIGEMVYGHAIANADF